MITSLTSIRDALSLWAAQFDCRIERYLCAVEDVPTPLWEAMRYSLLAPGKRIRPFLVDRCSELAGGPLSGGADHIGVAVECLHVYTLIHDDLPSMDNDDFRRGRPSNHKVFGEGMAVLAGDALLTLGFELLTRYTRCADMTVKLIRELSQAIGGEGVIGGQAIDIQSETLPPSLELTEYIHRRKTARLFRSCCRLGGLAAQADDDAIASLDSYGENLGLAFQIADDLLDIEEELPPPGTQAHPRKQTYPRCVGVDQSRTLGLEAVEKAIEALRPFGPQAAELQLLAQYIMSRSS